MILDLKQHLSEVVEGVALVGVALMEVALVVGVSCVFRVLVLFRK